MTDEVKAYLDYVRSDWGESGPDTDKFMLLAAAAMGSLDRAMLAAAGQDAPQHGVHNLTMPLLVFAAETLVKNLRSAYPEAGELANGLAEIFDPMMVTMQIPEVD